MRLSILPFLGVDNRDLQALIGDLAVQGIEAEVLGPRDVPSEAYDPDRRQYRAEALLQRVKEQPERHLLGVTDRDLYAGDLNFVFGLAQLPGKAALISLHRLRHGADEAGFRGRALKEAMHEIGHTLGLAHCPDPNCVMHFSNSLADTDRKGAIYCRVCRGKLEG